MTTIAAICAVAYFLYVWLKLDTFIEYMKLLPGKPFVKEYLDMEYPNTYPEYLLEYKPGFLANLLSCPICMSFWLGAASTAFVGLTAWPIVTFFGLLGYKLLDKLF